jgi:hypothetical protein
MGLQRKSVLEGSIYVKFRAKQLISLPEKFSQHLNLSLPRLPSYTHGTNKIYSVKKETIFHPWMVPNNRRKKMTRKALDLIL